MGQGEEGIFDVEVRVRRGAGYVGGGDEVSSDGVVLERMGFPGEVVGVGEEERRRARKRRVGAHGGGEEREGVGEAFEGV